jgi:hypothetical protein
MTRRSKMIPSQRIDLVQRRRTRDGDRYSEQPVPVTTQKFSGGGEGYTENGAVFDATWLSPDLTWIDERATWVEG